MNERTLRAKLKQPFNLENWKQIVEAGFPESTFYGVPDEVLFTRDQQRELAEHIHHIGEVSLDDGTTLAFIDVQLQKGATRLIQNRTGLRKLVDSEVIAGVREGAIIVYHQPDYKEWRISFYSETYDWDEKEGIIKEETNPKRYTFVVGGDETCRTAAERLHNLVGSASGLTIEDVMEAFSVEKVSKRFFDEYKHQYDKFVAHLTGEVWTKGGKQEVGEPIGQLNHFFKTRPGTDPKKEARDFVKKLLGRIVFLYFVQKKGWLGASSDEFEDGNAQFIRELFSQAKNHSDDDQFYSQWLRKLFFTGLNVKDPLTFTMPDGTSCFIPYLNGGLFDEDAIDAKLEGFTLPDALFHHPDFEDVPEDKYDRPNKRGFLDFLDAFNFTIHEDSPEDQTIGVDPEMLGHIFENLLEDNKEKGAYYTPKPIVHYMCQESLIEYLNTELEGDDELRDSIEELIKKQETAEVDHLFEEILTALQTVKVCDPAIGSGAFPMGILQEIYQTVETIFYASREDVDATWGLDEGDLNAADIKKQIIQHSIYGVDIEQGAVDIARLRFWLSLIVDEEKPTPLPNLEYKIVSGNSLISTLSLDGSEQAVEINWELEGEVEGTKKYLDELREILKTTVQKQQQYFSTDKAHGAALRDDIKELKIDALITQLQFDRYYYEQTTADKGGALPSAKDKEHNLNREIKIADYSDTIKKLQQVKENENTNFNYFDWKLDFSEVLNPVMAGEKAGFDIVIANPPYMRVQEIQKNMPEEKKLLEKKFKNANASYDLANLFFELAVSLGKPDSSNCFIFPHKFFNSASASVFRDYLFEGKFVDKIAHFGANMVFNDADTYTCIAFFSSRSNDGFLIQKFGLGEDYEKLIQKSGNYSFVPYSKLTKASKLYGSNQWILFNTDLEYDIFEHMYSRSRKFDDVFEDIFQGIATSKDALYVLNSTIEKNGHYHGEIFRGDQEVTVEKEFFKPLLKGSDIHRYEPLETQKYVFFPYIIDGDEVSVVELEELEKNYPKTYDYVMRNAEEFKSRESGRAGKMNYWYEYIYPKNRTKFDQKKLSSMEICTNHPNVTLDKKGFYHNTKVYSWVKKEEVKESYEFFLAIANSNLLWWFLLNTGDTLRGDARTLKTNYLNPFPIPQRVASETDQKFQKIVQKILSRKDEGGDTTEFEAEVDRMVYQLYGLSEEEIQIIEQAVG
jgi:hypothetical protein